MPLLTPVFAGGSFAATRDFSVDFGSGADRGLLVLVFSEGVATPGGTPIASCVIEPAGANVALTAGLERDSAPIIAFGGRLRAFWIAGASVPTGVRTVRVTGADGNGKLQVWALPFDGFSAVSAETLANGATANLSITVPSAAGRTAVAFVHAFAQVDGATMSPAAPATLVRRVLMADNAVLVGSIWQEAGAASTVVDGTWTNPNTVWGIVGWSLTPGAGGGTAPTITVQPTNQSAVAGANATFSASATGTALTYQWRRNGTPISGATSSSYTFATVIGDDGAVFSVVVTGDTAPPVTSNNATLTVNASGSAPVVTQHPQNVSITVGQTATFTAAFSGVPTPTLQWRRNGTNIAGATSGSYTFTPQLSDSGAVFSCVGTNPTNSATTNPATLTVNAPATFSMSFPGGVAVDAGGTKRLSQPWTGYAVPWNPANPGAAASAVRTPISGTTAPDGAISVTGLSAAGLTNARLFFGTGTSAGVYTLIGTAA